MIGLLWLAGWLWSLGCEGSSATHLPYTTMRIEELPPEVQQTGGLKLDIFTDDAECNTQVTPDIRHRCLPFVDRGKGEVHLMFRTLYEGEQQWILLEPEQVDVTFQGSQLPADATVSVERFDGRRSNQLFVLMIDGSASMLEAADESGQQSRIERLRNALVRKDVVQAFFPGTVSTGVVVFVFTNGTPKPLGGNLEVITDADQYRALIIQHLSPPGGYTHLYDAARYATGPLLREEAIRRFVDNYTASPTVVLLSDGFNNQDGGDTCATNLERINPLLTDLRKSRASKQVITRPVVYTVGLGKKYRSYNIKKALAQGFGPRQALTARELCGKNPNARIDGVLERTGLDNVSLAWIAQEGGGSSYVERDAKKLAEALRQAAQDRYRVFAVRYRINPLLIRRSFETRLILPSYLGAEARLKVYPSAFFDPPPAGVGPDGWAVPSTFPQTAATIMPLLGATVVMSFLSAFLFNTRRALFRRRPRPARRPRGG